ncbi:cell division protein ZipA [Fontimonas thermophila]|uniref:Cell division protein ZipA n=1 Tax=Fontimonas thermophila TaxID=1076937 RepID=A0A1I2HXW1_9GAMM|nr:cell division protein ZipA C-terminal FtsZ-binding domain-containing protein [Fontimonas thermophila]SFF34200.1 cell division protein ZipA [Fontimonas thermophila]
MSPLQWALLVVGAVAVLAIYIYSRRERAHPPRGRPDVPTPAVGSSAPPAVNDQMDMFARGGFDELGVGKPRKRIAPSMPAAEPEAKAPTSAKVEERIIAVLIAEREGTAIFGPKIHAALRAQGLRFGDKRIYHRIEGGRPVFSVASLIKPGYLDPAEQQAFSTPGLTVFMLLPGPVPPETAIGDMLGTARALAQQLNAEVYDSNRQVLTVAAEKALIADVKAWARQHGL